MSARSNIDPKEVTITCGSTEARFVSITLLAKPGSAVWRPGEPEPIRGAAHLAGAELLRSVKDAADVSVLYLCTDDEPQVIAKSLQQMEAVEGWIVWDMSVADGYPEEHPAQNPKLTERVITIGGPPEYFAGLARGLDGGLGSGAAFAGGQTSHHHLHNQRLPMDAAGVLQDANMVVNANPNIPEEVRAVAADGTQLRYALMEMAREMDDVIALGRGDPDLDTPPHIVEAAKSAIRDGRASATPVKGMEALRAAIADHLRAVNGLPVAAENVMVTTGGQEGLFLAIQALIDPGDEILVPTRAIPPMMMRFAAPAALWSRCPPIAKRPSI